MVDETQETELDLPVDDGLDLPELEAPTTKWPKVIGIISLIYAIGGILCNIGGVVGGLMSGFFVGLAGLDVEVPAAVKYQAAVSAVLFLPLSILLLLGAIRLLGRRRTGVSMHKTWAVLRLVMVVISVVVGILMLPTSIQFERSVQEATVRLARERGGNVPDRPFDEDFAWKKGVVMTGVSAGVFSVYPLFLGFYLSRRKIGDEVETWA